ncbi:hypothetical protein TNIN_273711 [Trichonephila inaurata madagascariensis]|uniref:Uncharacterized protein n=1 Tax=Trichonephila inaurata madagascariensis TaxID=2747483 RepID=A0A8X7CI70_9ARAC|nr:hypothetical protein TNIN_273711 [Trichonephila inaurata madagascariensis]
MGDMNESGYHLDLQDLINALEDNNDVEKDNEYPPLTMKERSLDHFNNPEQGPLNCQPHSRRLGVAVWKQRSREPIWKRRNLQFSEERIRFSGYVFP